MVKPLLSLIGPALVLSILPSNLAAQFAPGAVQGYVTGSTTDSSSGSAATLDPTSSGQPVATPADPAEAAKAAKENKRIQKLTKLKFDRRPATILKEWARPSEEVEELKKQAAAPEPDEKNAASKNASDKSTDSKKTGETKPGNESAGDEQPANNGTNGALVLTAPKTEADQPTKTTKIAGEPNSTGGEPNNAGDTGEDPAKPKLQPFDAKLQLFQRDVTLGKWQKVKEFIATISEKEGKAAYTQLLKALHGAAKELPPGLSPELAAQYASVVQSRNSQLDPRLREHNQFSFEDILDLVRAAPCALEKEAISDLGLILRLPIRDGNSADSLIELLKQEASRPEPVLSKRQMAQVLIAAGEAIRADTFLPTVEEAKREGDHEGLNLLSRHYLARHSKDDDRDFLEQAWNLTQAVFESSEIDKEQREEALRRAVELAPRVSDEFGDKWLEDSFIDKPQRGMEIIAAIGTAAANGLKTRPTDPTFRLKSIKLQTTAVEALLDASEERADDWNEMLTLLAMNWVREAVASYLYDESSSSSNQLLRDRYGNYFYADGMGIGRSTSSRNSRIRPIPTTELLATRPSEGWLKRIDTSLLPKFNAIFAQLYLKVNEEDKAFPCIEQLANEHPDQAKELVDEFLKVWTRNHDPNASRNRTNYYMFMYGYERKAESIPLTRSKQERNLTELAELVTRLRALPLEKLDEKLLARAFTTCHSNAEVYRLESIEAVFGSIGDLDPSTLSELAQQMRANLMGIWRQPKVQQQNKTKRKQQDIQTEVLRGYSVARQVIQNGLEKHNGHWALQLAIAALDHDENNYRQELERNSKFSKQRDQAFASFEAAAKKYSEQLADIDETDQTTRVFELWYYASLGACDLQHVSEDAVPELKQPKRIREAILALAGEAAERHMAMFANSLFTRMSAVNPAVKHRYLMNGFEIVGDHKRAREARKVFDYYRDLITEIKLETTIDGSDTVGHERPFGVFVNISHTREIERESGGFGRYLQNQNSRRSYSYNYGRPTEDYRDKFEEIVRQALSEHFEVLSVTFQSDDVRSKAQLEYGWRTTPYAYLLLQARGPEIDKIPPVRLDLDFLDTSGYVIIPIESPLLPIDATAGSAEPRPVQNLTVTQTLDERQAYEGKLILEVKASGQGLVPEFDALFDFDPGQFDIVENNDEGLSVSSFDSEAEDNVILSERTWMVSMTAKDNLLELPSEFAFAVPKIGAKELVHQRYVDADLLAVEANISLEEQYGEVSYAWLWALVMGTLVVAAIVLVVRRMTRGSAHEVAAKRFQLPVETTPFTVIGLLKDIQLNNGLDDAAKDELSETISRLQNVYFGADPEKEPDLNQIAQSWVQRSV